jgi:hypothetical protein
LPIERAAALIKNSLILVSQKIKKIKSLTNIIQNLCPFMQNRGFILAIESSCDDTAAAVYTTIKYCLMLLQIN